MPEGSRKSMLFFFDGEGIPLSSGRKENNMEWQCLPLRYYLNT
jgi:hypothetical protein